MTDYAKSSESTFYTNEFLTLDRGNWTEWDTKLRALLQFEIKDVEVLDLLEPAHPDHVHVSAATENQNQRSNLSALYYLLQVFSTHTVQRRTAF